MQSGVRVVSKANPCALPVIDSTPSHCDDRCLQTAASINAVFFVLILASTIGLIYRSPATIFRQFFGYLRPCFAPVGCKIGLFANPSQ
jgi:hypothetical protein